MKNKYEIINTPINTIANKYFFKNLFKYLSLQQHLKK
jgi:hypothetical protein